MRYSWVSVHGADWWWGQVGCLFALLMPHGCFCGCERCFETQNASACHLLEHCGFTAALLADAMFRRMEAVVACRASHGGFAPLDGFVGLRLQFSMTAKPFPSLLLPFVSQQLCLCRWGAPGACGVVEGSVGSGWLEPKWWPCGYGFEPSRHRGYSIDGTESLAHRCGWAHDSG